MKLMHCRQYRLQAVAQLGQIKHLHPRHQPAEIDKRLQHQPQLRQHLTPGLPRRPPRMPQVQSGCGACESGVPW